MKTYIINRPTWRNGEESKHAKGLGDTAMKNEEGFMCCLGQCVIQDNLDKEDWKIGTGEPNCFAGDNNLEEDSFFYVVQEDEAGILWHENTSLSMKAMEINDSANTTLPQKEKALKELFKNNGLEIKFIGKSVKFKK